ncbi:YoaK family protein [Curvibacter sp. HBC61]|uniref:YoaK family protein n=1 Tax=Curvibacter cyanobacteriorum TaxID=3026422 RepID=A0ABT5N216_9BURK|nr:YoaK family protein [Curvibacter sp. HBC61]MDD0840342.1 YoaK family protein [Curvibacter sp. HBC61]
MRRLRHLTGLHRTPSINRMLGFLLAFNAGAINAGGFLVVGMYTSHMSGFVSMLADHLVLGNLLLVVSACGVLLSFTCGAAVTALLVNWARVHHLRSGYALPLLLEALLMLLFGLIGGTLNHQTPFAVPVTVLLLAFIMGLQNAVVSKMSSAQIRTTHMTGVLTDLGIELGKLVYWNGRTPAPVLVRANRHRLRLLGTLLGLFTVGGVVGAAGFKHIGFIWVLPLAAVLLLLSLPPLLGDLRRLGRMLEPEAPGPAKGP